MSNALASALPTNLSVGTFDAYLNVVGQMPLLSREREQELALAYARDGDLDAARELVMSNLRFVVHVARSYSGYGLPLPDIIQEGNVGLMKAVKRFDPAIGVRLVSFAVHWIRAEIHEYVIKNWRIVKVATTKAQRKLFFNLRKSKSNLAWLSEDEASSMAKDLGVDIKTVYEMEKRMDGKDMAFDLPHDETTDDSYNAPVSYLEQSDADPATLLENAEWDGREKRQLTQALANLDERSLDILNSRWLADEKATLHDLAARYNVSAERIRQLEKNAMKKLKEAMVLEA
ncbi:MAG: RNA polymerase sigma factor RpoH [Gammaproteobacteria bacterium HGW-Gammaproteobacteria-3]|nr:MAG: RNA polymerase sigma factor RpoH [Gammaproteobacteria bacterium HGW-Gammaproteobacteria-3]